MTRARTCRLSARLTLQVDGGQRIYACVYADYEHGGADILLVGHPW